MSARKLRPGLGASVTPDMSIRDIGAALGVSTAEIHRWQGLAALPDAEFESRLQRARLSSITATAILSTGKPVPARGRVQRAAAIFTGMNAAERAEFLGLIIRTGETA